MKRKLLFAAMLIAGALGGQLRAQMTDVTSTYITNPSFESDGNSAESNSNLTITGWTEVQSYAAQYNDTQTRDASTASASAFGDKIAPADGTYYLFYRHGWNGDNGNTATFTTTTKSTLPAGIYRLEFKYQQSYSEDSESKNKTRIKLAAKNGDTEVASITKEDATKGATFGNDKWNTSYFFFNLSEAASINFEFTLYAGGQKRSDFLLDGIRLLKAENPTEPIASNTTDLYLYNEKEGLYVSAGKSWGTHATVDNYGYEMTATLSNGLYTLKTQQYNKYLSGLYMDSGSGNWLFLETASGSGKYYMTQDGVNYMTSNGAGAELINVTTPTDASVWSIISKADRKTALSSATVGNPGDATFLIADANFSRNATSSVWNGTSKTSDNKTNLTLAGGSNENMCAESYHATFSIKQTLSALKAGVYSLTAQGFYRQDGTDNENLPYFYLGDEKVTFPLKTGAENSMSDASASFSAGSYTTKPIYVRVEENGSIDLGAKLEGENYSLWCIWDNFQLTYYGDVTVAAVKMKASVDAYNAALAEAQAFAEASMFAADWNALQNVISSNVIDLNDPDLTESALNTATANLVAANEAATAAVATKTKYDNAATLIGDGTADVDLTRLLGNPSFETTAAYALAGDGWVNEGVGVQGQTNTGFDGYRVGNVFAERWVASGSIAAFKTYQTVTLPAGLYKITAVATFNGNGASLFANDSEATITDAATYTLMVQVSDQEVLELGVQAVSPTGSWFKADNFTLTYLADYPAYTLASGKMGTDKSAAQSAAESTFLGAKTVANYNALMVAINAAQASVANYATLKTAIDRANAILEANNFVTAAATTALQDEINDATNGWNDVTFTDAEATAEIAALGSNVSGHRGNKDGKAGNYVVSAWNTFTDGETHAWDGYVINTWSTEGDNDGSGFSVPFLEYWVSNTNNLPAKTMTATLSGLPNGMYEIELWARVQRRSDADFNSDNSMITMKVNNGEAVSIMSNTSNNVGTETSVMRLGRYTAVGEVTDGTLTLTINVKLGANVHWLSWRDVKYTKLDEATMKISVAQYATFIAPFDVTIPEGVTAYTVGGVESNGSTLSMTEVANTIAANTPVVLFSENTLNQTFTGKAVEATNNLTEGLLTGVYAATPAPANSYVLQNNDNKVGFYLVQEGEQPTVGANRAYLTKPATGYVRAAYFFDNETAIQGVFDGLKHGEIYDIAGRKVSRMQKGGVYVVAGKKVVIK